jgi:hypothetical protein
VRRMGFNDMVRMRLGVCLIILFALVSNMRLLGRAVHDLTALTQPDEITEYEARFKQLKQVLPPHARVGYVTDARRQDGESRSRPFMRYLLTQYALLPVIVLRDSHQPLIVGNFYSANGIDAETTRGLTLIRDFGNGVMLFRASPE